MNTTQYFKHDNFLVVQNGDFNDTFDLNGQYVNEFFDVKEYLETQNYSELSLQRIAIHLSKRHIQYDNDLRFGYTKCIIPNPKVTIDYLNDTSSQELQGRFGFYLNNRFVFAIYSKDFTFLESEGELSKDQYCKIVFELDKENRNKLNEIIQSLNTLAKYDAN